MTYHFSDGEFMTARQKELVLKAWVLFLKHGLRSASFTKRLYEHLIQHCSFIAHYDRGGFHRTYFESGADTVRFLSQFDKRGECRSVEYGGRWWLQGDYADLNRAMVEEAARYIPSLIESARASEREADLAEAKRLLAKHGLQR
ncbi:MAG: hypothetical protein ABSH47_18040 [Bryobacteraceae bacterium]|jgi:hypothetical protein